MAGQVSLIFRWSLIFVESRNAAGMDTTASEQLLGHPSSATDHTGGCEKVQIDFNSVTYIVNKGSKTEKTVLADTSCSLHSGALTALMGYSASHRFLGEL